MLQTIKSVLIANRGEIALRIIRACRELQVRSVVAYSEADAASWPVRDADAAICIGPPQAAQSYRNQQALIGAAKAFGIDAIHPGYGFLSESPDVAKACEEAGIIFIGPSSEVIRQMGSKIEAKHIARAAAVPTIPGSDGAVSDPAEALAIAESVGLPLLIKASAGGGGRGMRVVTHAADLPTALQEIMSEAETAFGDPSVYIEKYLTDVRHIEVQILSDGEVAIHLGERDCTVQRRNQKLIEESPSPALDATTRDELLSSALRLVASVGYRNAGTVEYVFDNAENKFYFIEMNTRVQVEHPVSELVTGIDIIKAQLRIADGQPIGIAQDDVRFAGHAIECRLNAEMPAECGESGKPLHAISGYRHELSAAGRPWHSPGQPFGGRIRYTAVLRPDGRQASLPGVSIGMRRSSGCCGHWLRCGSMASTRPCTFSEA